MEPDLINIPEYIKLSGHSTQNVYRWIREGKVKPVYIQKTIEVACLPKNLIIKKVWSPKQNLK